MKGHDAVNEILPWYANGTATSEERDAVATHLRECAECRGELEFLQEVRAAAAEVAEAAPAVGDSFRRTLAAVDQWEASRPPGVTQRVAAFFDALLHPRPGLARAAFAAQFVLILVLGGLLLLSRPQEPSFTTLSGGGAAAGGGARLTVIFEPTVTEATLRTTLLDIGGTVVSGPSALGVYVVELPGSAAVDAVVERLRGNPSVVRFVERQP